jgi:endogenous inhibitor of DNA gyrase (YacG/DUF329 family)
VSWQGCINCGDPFHPHDSMKHSPACSKKCSDSFLRSLVEEVDQTNRETSKSFFREVSLMALLALVMVAIFNEYQGMIGMIYGFISAEMIRRYMAKMNPGKDCSWRAILKLTYDSKK